MPHPSAQGKCDASARGKGRRRAGEQAASGPFLLLPVDGKYGGFPPALGGSECRQVCGLLGGIQQQGTGPDSSTGKSLRRLWSAARALLAVGLLWFVRGFLCALSCPDEAHTCILQLASKPSAAGSILTPLLPLPLHLEHPSTTGRTAGNCRDLAAEGAGAGRCHGHG